MFKTLFKSSDRIDSVTNDEKQNAIHQVPDISTLDVTFVSARVLALGCPTNNLSDPNEHLINVIDLHGFVNEYYPHHALSWCLGYEKWMPSKKKLAAGLGCQLCIEQWDGIGTTKSLISVKRLKRICESIKAWLDVDKKNVAIVFSPHELRTNVLLACHLRHAGGESSAFDVYKRVQSQRNKHIDSHSSTFNAMEPLSPSLRALLSSFDTCILGDYFQDGIFSTLTSVSIQNLCLNSGQPFHIEVWNGCNKAYSSLGATNDSVIWNQSEGHFFLKCDVKLDDDFQVAVMCGSRRTSCPVLVVSGCVALIAPDSASSIPLSEVDVLPTTLTNAQPITGEDFIMTLVWGEGQSFCENVNNSIHILPSEQELPFMYLRNGCVYTRVGLLDISSMHYLSAAIRPLDHLLSLGYDAEAVTLALQLSQNDVNRALALLNDGLAAMMDITLGNSSVNSLTPDLSYSDTESSICSLSPTRSTRLRAADNARRMDLTRQRSSMSTTTLGVGANHNVSSLSSCSSSRLREYTKDSTDLIWNEEEQPMIDGVPPSNETRVDEPCSEEHEPSDNLTPCIVVEEYQGISSNGITVPHEKTLNASDRGVCVNDDDTTNVTGAAFRSATNVGVGGIVTEYSDDTTNHHVADVDDLINPALPVQHDDVKYSSIPTPPPLPPPAVPQKSSIPIPSPRPPPLRGGNNNMPPNSSSTIPPPPPLLAPPNRGGGPGAIPPPPVLPGMRTASTGGLNNKPRENRRKLHWQAIPQHRLSNRKKSIWDADEQVGDVNIDMEEFEALFVEKLGNKEAPKKKVAKKGPLVVSLLDRKRAMNISIATAAIKMSYSNIQSVISSMEENILEETQLTQLVENLPTAQEKKMLQEYIENEGGNTERLGNAEKYMAAIITVPFGDQRLKCMVFKSQFPSMVDAFSSNVELINAACDDVMSSSRLKTLLNIILKLGNQLNQKDAAGFTFDSLLKLNSAKAFDKRTSILHYLVMVVERHDKLLLDFKVDLPHMFPASRISFSTLVEQLKDLNEIFALLKSLTANDPQLLPYGYIIPTMYTVVKELNRSSHSIKENITTSTGATTSTSCTSNNEAAEESESTSTKPAVKSHRKLLEIANMKSSLRDAVGSDGKRFQHFDNVKVVSSSSHDVTLSEITSDGSSHVAGVVPEMSTTEETKARQDNVILQGTKQQNRMVKFMEDAMVQLSRLELLLKGSNKKFQSVLCYCGENPELTSLEFFSTLHAFCGAFDEARRYVDRQNRMRLKMAKKKKQI